MLHIPRKRFQGEQGSYSAPSIISLTVGEQNISHNLENSLLPRPENGPGTQAGKERVMNYLQAHARDDAIFPPKTGGKNHIWKKSPYFGIVYSECFYTGFMGIM